MLSPIDKRHITNCLKEAHVGSVTDEPEYLVEVDHHDVVEDNLRSLYTERDEVVELTYKNSTAERCIPDIILYFEEIDAEVAIEVKVNTQDFRSALFQCRMYRADGLAPYVAVPTNLNSVDSTTVKRALMEFDANTPGFIMLGQEHISVKRQPKYDI